MSGKEFPCLMDSEVKEKVATCCHSDLWPLAINKRIIQTKHLPEKQVISQTWKASMKIRETKPITHLIIGDISISSSSWDEISMVPSWLSERWHGCIC